MAVEYKNKKTSYLGNKKLKKSSVTIEWTEEQILEMIRCKEDSIYFIEKYCKIIHVDRGLVNFELHPFQKNMISAYSQNRFVICKMPRQVGKCNFYLSNLMVRNINTNRISSISIGELYERFSNLRTVQKTNERAFESSIQNTQNQCGDISSTISRSVNEVGSVAESPVIESSWKQQPWLSARGQAESFLEKLYWGERREYPQESFSVSQEKRQRHNELGLLVEKNGRGSGRSQETFERETINLQLREMYRETRQERSSNLGGAPSQMDENIRPKNSRRKTGDKEKKVPKNRQNIKTRKTVGKINRNRDSWNTKTISDSMGESILLLRHFLSRKDYRIQRRLLACESRKKHKGFQILEKRKNGFGGRDLGKRQKENICSREFWIPSDDYLGERFYTRPAKNNSEVFELSEQVERKFVDSIDVDGYEVWTDTGWQPFSAIHKTIEYREWVLKTTGHNLICADDHIVFRDNGEQVFVKDLKPGDYIKTDTGVEEVVSVEETDKSSHMYDITVDSDDHRFYSNGILSHNTTTTAGFILWRVLFNEHYNVAILANKDKKAREILDRIQKMFENLPQWMQQGVTEWNKGNIELENGSKIVATSTSSSAARGDTYNCVSGDSNITIRVDGKVMVCSIKELEHMLANSSKYTKFINSELVEDLIDVSRKQIHQDIFQFDEKTLSWTVNRAASHHTEMYGWNESERQFDQSFYKSPSSCTQTFDQNGNRSRTQEENVLCLREDGQWSSRKVFENKFDHTKTNTFGAIRTTKTENDWKKAFDKNKRKNFNSSFGETTQTSFSTNEIVVVRTEKRGFEIRFPQKENIKIIDWTKKEPRSHNENKPKSRENKENCRKTQRYEEISRSKTQNEFGQKGQGSLEQRIEVLTEKGFKRFHGLRKTKLQKTIQLFVGEKQIVCTPEHKIMTNFGWISAQDCLGKSIITSCGNLICNKIQTHLDEDVYDILHVDDTNSFYANDILVHNCVYLDEFAHVEKNVQEDFFASVYPTISSGETTQLIITSTPKGMELFYKIWTESEEGRNSYVRVDVHWSDVPGRDEKWKAETIANTSEDLFRQEHECLFLGSSNTLIHPTKLRNLSHKRPTLSNTLGLKEYHPPEKDVIYAIVVDTARGVGEDSSAFIVFNVNTFPYKICCTFKSNLISPLVYPNIIYETAKRYNDALILVETNDIGQQVADILYHDLQYEGVLVSALSGRAGQTLSGGFATSTHRGIRTTKQVKRIGCATLKTLVESDKLIIEDYDTIYELSRFVQKGQSYEAESGNDDLAMCCVLFGWLTSQPYFKEITDLDIRKKIYEQNEKMIEEEMLPFGMYSSGNDEYDSSVNEASPASRDEFSRFMFDNNSNL